MTCPTSHRYFLAIRPPPVLARQIGESAPWFGPGRAILPGHLHVTLGAAGDHDMPSEAVAAVLRGAADTVAARPFRVAFDLVVGSPTSVALRPSEPLAPLVRLQQALDAALREAGFAARAGWRFDPHMTLLYRDGPRFRWPVDPVSWLVEEFVLIHSFVGETRHDVEGRWRLGDGGLQAGGSVQSIGGSPRLARNVFAFEKWRQPKKPLCADSGEGWGALSTR